jgi:hypothetical protein
MKSKTLWLTVIAICLFLLPGAALCGENGLSGYVILRNDFKFPQATDKREYMFQRLNIYAQQKMFGAGLDVDYAHTLDYMRVRPYFSVNFDPLYLTFGYQSFNFKSAATSHVQTGVGVAKSLGSWNGFIDVRNYWGIDKKSGGFLELWAGIYRKIGEKLFVGAEVGFVHWWKNSSPHNWVLAGPTAGYNFSKDVSASIRLARTWNIEADKRAMENEIQLRLKYAF